MPEGEADSVRHEVEVLIPAPVAFETFTADLSGWWPPEFTWSQDALKEIGIECEEGGACYELGPHDFRCDWGRVVQWDPPRSFTFSWQISPDRVPEPDPAKASEVVVSFESAGSTRSRVVLEHRDFSRHGGKADAYRIGMDKGWAYLLDRYVATAHRRAA